MTTNNNSKSKNNKATRVGQLIAGSKKRLNAGQTLTLNGDATNVGAVTTELQGFIDNRAAVVAAQATVRTKVAAERAALPVLNALIKAFIAFVRLTFGNDAEALADFGLAPLTAPTPPTAEAKAAAVAKREATREARGTKTAKQKKAIHGNVTAKLVVTPAAEPADATPAAAPAAAAAPSATAPNKG